MFIWNKSKSTLSYKGMSYNKGMEIPSDFPKGALKKLKSKGKVIEKIAAPKVGDTSKLLKNAKNKISGLKTALTKAENALGKADDSNKAEHQEKVNKIEADLEATKIELDKLESGSEQ